MPFLKIYALFSVSIMLCIETLVFAQAAPMPANFVPPAMRGIEIEDKRGVEIPHNLRFFNQNQQEISLNSYLSDNKPVLLVFAYYSCPTLCTLVLNALNQGLKDLAWTVGKEFRVITLSIDDRDTSELASKKRQNYLTAYGRPVPERGWDFLTGSQDSVRQLAQTVGFNYRWDSQTKQFAHAAGIFFITPQGKVSNSLVGLSFPSSSLRLALTEASNGKLGALMDRIKLVCYQYDPNSHSYVFTIHRIVKIVGALLFIFLSIWLFRFWKQEYKKNTIYTKEAPL